MVLNSIQVSITRLNQGGQGPLVDGIRVEGFVQGRRDKWLKVEPSTEIDAGAILVTAQRLEKEKFTHKFYQHPTSIVGSMEASSSVRGHFR
jgi:hypothetical protein